MSESWRKVWREGIALQLTVEQLEALKRGLISDDPALLQGATCSPPPLQCVQDWNVEAACAIGYCGWKTGCKTVAETEEFFAKVCFEADRAIGEPAACRWYLSWYDDTPREEMRRLLLEEVNLTLEARKMTVEDFKPGEFFSSGGCVFMRTNDNGRDKRRAVHRSGIVLRFPEAEGAKPSTLDDWIELPGEIE